MRCSLALTTQMQFSLNTRDGAWALSRTQIT